MTSLRQQPEPRNVATHFNFSSAPIPSQQQELDEVVAAYSKLKLQNDAASSFFSTPQDVRVPVQVGGQVVHPQFTNWYRPTLITHTHALEDEKESHLLQTASSRQQERQSAVGLAHKTEGTFRVSQPVKVTNSCKFVANNDYVVKESAAGTFYPPAAKRRNLNPELGFNPKETTEYVDIRPFHFRTLQGANHGATSVQVP